MEITNMDKPQVSVDNIAVLVIDRNHARFGELGRLMAHDWKENGDYIVRFPKGDEITHFPDNSQTPQVKNFYAFRDDMGRKYDEDGLGPFGLIRNFLDLKCGDLRDFVNRYEAAFEKPFQ
jgi:hypothetical protein